MTNPAASGPRSLAASVFPTNQIASSFSPTPFRRPPSRPRRPISLRPVNPGTARHAPTDQSTSASPRLDMSTCPKSFDMSTRSPNFPSPFDRSTRPLGVPFPFDWSSRPGNYSNTPRSDKSPPVHLTPLRQPRSHALPPHCGPRRRACSHLHLPRDRSSLRDPLLIDRSSLHRSSRPDMSMHTCPAPYRQP